MFTLSGWVSWESLALNFKLTVLCKDSSMWMIKFQVKRVDNVFDELPLSTLRKKGRRVP